MRPDRGAMMGSAVFLAVCLAGCASKPLMGERGRACNAVVVSACAAMRGSPCLVEVAVSNNTCEQVWICNGPYVIDKGGPIVYFGGNNTLLVLWAAPGVRKGVCEDSGAHIGVLLLRSGQTVRWQLALADTIDENAPWGSLVDSPLSPTGLRPQLLEGRTFGATQVVIGVGFWSDEVVRDFRGRHVRDAEGVGEATYLDFGDCLLAERIPPNLYAEALAKEALSQETLLEHYAVLALQNLVVTGPVPLPRSVAVRCAGRPGEEEECSGSGAP